MQQQQLCSSSSYAPAPIVYQQLLPRAPEAPSYFESWCISNLIFLSQELHPVMQP
jgi:hypothetical protein